jgi:hypothetical protein
LPLARFTHNRDHEFEAHEIRLDDGTLGLVLQELDGQPISYEGVEENRTRLETRCDFCGRWSVEATPIGREPHPRWKCDASTGCL